MDAGSLLEPEWAHCGDADWAGGTIMTCGYRAGLRATPEEIWQAVRRIGGRTGWYWGNVLWRLRGIIDRMAGGVGLRRGRRHPTEIHVGDALDFWRVLDVDAPHRLLLVAEMKTPGEALLEFKVSDTGNGQAELQMLSRFLPKGILGILYWYGLYPFNQGGFNGPVNRYTPRGYVRDHSNNAVWGMQFVWPFTAEYRIIYLTGDYSHFEMARLDSDTIVHRHIPQRISTTTRVSGQSLMVAMFVRS